MISWDCKSVKQEIGKWQNEFLSKTPGETSQAEKCTMRGNDVRDYRTILYAAIQVPLREQSDEDF